MVKGLSNIVDGLESVEPEHEEEGENEKAIEDDLIVLWDKKHSDVGNPLFSRETSDYEQVAKQRTLSVLLQTFVDAKDILLGKVPSAREGLLLALSAAVLNQACASTSILIYAQKLLSTVGVQTQTEQDAQSALLIAAKLLGVIVGLFLVETLTRRALLATGGICSAVALGVIVLGAQISSNEILMVGMGCFVLCFFSTWGVGYWAVVVEVTAAGGPRYASAAQAMATATLFGSGWLTSLTFVQVMSLGSLGLLIYVCVAVLMFAYGLCWLPETSGHSLEQCAHDVEVKAQGGFVPSEDSETSESSTDVEKWALNPKG